MPSKNNLGLNWEQGSFLDSDDLRKFRISQNHLEEDLDDGAYGIVISHTCDLHSGNIENEPFIECILAYEHDYIPHTSGSKLNSKSPRELVIECSDDSHEYPKEFYLRILMKTKFSLDKKMFFDIQPNVDLKLIDSMDDRTSSFSHWLGTRYCRPTLPDGFDIPFKKAIKSSGFRTFIDKNYPYFYTISIHLYPNRELRDGENYTGSILILIKKPLDNDLEEILANKVQKLKSKCKKLNLNIEVHHKNFEKFSVADYSLYQPIYFDSISISNEESAEIH